MPIFRDIAGERFGSLVALAPVGSSKNRTTMWRCLCDCGNERVTIVSKLTARIKPVRTCGCLSSRPCVRCGNLTPPNRKRWCDSADCQQERRTQRAAKARLGIDKEKIKVNARKYRYGITQDKYEAMRESQEQRCAICREELNSRAAVDHDHVTNQVRGILCVRCNIGLHYIETSAWRQQAEAHLKAYLASGICDSLKGGCK